MKKNGFIATSLIYSFFLIFITLFLTIVADYLQNKVSLSVIEKSIKDEINNSIGIKDFEVGDILSQSSIITGDDDIWLVAKVEVNNIDTNNSALYLYSYETNDSVTEISGEFEILTIEHVDNDLKFGGVYNNTYLNKLLYNFNGDYFNLSNYKIEKSSNCVYLNDNIISNSCEANTDSKYRIRKKVKIGNNRYIKTVSPDGSMTLTGVK